MSHNIEIQEGALLLGDAHYSHKRPELLSFIQKIHSKELQTSQLILMGDVFDALFGTVAFTYASNIQIIQLLNEIAQEIEVIYLEGNHDFNLRDFFPDIKIYSINMQPIICHYKQKKVYLAHGDFDVGLMYKMYTACIRSPFILYILQFIDTLSNHCILKTLDKHLNKKNDCKEFIGFEKFVQARLGDRYKCDYFIEGHFHQNRHFRVDNFEYFNLAAFACNQRYFIVKSLEDKELLEEKRLS